MSASQQQGGERRERRREDLERGQVGRREDEEESCWESDKASPIDGMTHARDLGNRTG